MEKRNLHLVFGESLWNFLCYVYTYLYRKKQRKWQRYESINQSLCGHFDIRFVYESKVQVFPLHITISYRDHIYGM